MVTPAEFTIYKVIDIVRRRPGMYIGDPSPEKLDVYLHGYRAAMHHAGKRDASDPPFHGFHLWVARRLGFGESTAGWSNMILAVTLGLNPRTIRWEGYNAAATSDQLKEATERCFALLDEYRGEKGGA
jgi:hypothetical protein